MSSGLIQEELFAGKGAISLGLDNSFRESMTMQNEVNAIDYEQHIRFNNYNREALITFDYRFGKTVPRRRKSI